MYPNPIQTSNENLHIRLRESSQEVRLEILSVTGKVVYSSDCSADCEALEVTLHDKFENGMYLVRVKTRSGEYVRKLIAY
jgi:hypothetical protein